MSQKEIIELPTTKHLYEQTGFSEAVKAGNLVFISGQVGWDDNLKPKEGLREQIRQAYRNMQKVIEKAGGTMDDIVQIMTFHVDTGKPFWEEAQVLWEVTKEMLQNGRPCGTGVMVKQLAMPELLIEIQAVAVLKEK